MNRSWNRLGHWADKRLPGLALFAFLLLMSQLEQARATDIELPASDDGNMALVVLILVWIGLLLLCHVGERVLAGPQR
jgi:hypothetical protein